ncbi:MAG: glycosyltransferase family 39 protein [Candidatus Rokubacteria bacterium]|nr:glycosyltransferase family 39 protein [Candidatus Rokubacteria bacterium]
MRLGLLLAAALVLRLAAFGGLLGWDDVEYAEAARRLAAGAPVPPSMFDLRYGVTLPLAAAQALTGAGEGALAVAPMLYALAELAVAYALGAAYGGRAVGLLAAALLAVVPLGVLAASDVHADLPASVFMALTVLAVLRGEAAGRRRSAWFAAAGLALGAAYLTKEVALALGLVLAARAAWLRRAPGGYAWLAGAFLLVVALDLGVSYARTGDPLFRYAPAVAAEHAWRMRLAPPGAGWMLEFPGMLLLPWSGSFGYFAGLGWLALAGAAWGLARRDRTLGELALWWGLLLAVFNFAPLDATFTRPLFFHFARTLHPLLVPLALTAAVWLVRGLAGRPALSAGVLLVVAALAIPGVWLTRLDHRGWAAVARQAAPLIAREPPEARVATDRITAGQLRTLLPGRRERIVAWTDAPALAVGRAGLLVLRDPLLLASDRAHGAPVPAAVLAPPATWERVAELGRPVRPRLRDLLTGRGAPAPPEPAVLWRIPPADGAAR